MDHMQMCRLNGCGPQSYTSLLRQNSTFQTGVYCNTGTWESLFAKFSCCLVSEMMSAVHGDLTFRYPISQWLRRKPAPETKITKPMQVGSSPWGVRRGNPSGPVPGTCLRKRPALGGKPNVGKQSRLTPCGKSVARRKTPTSVHTNMPCYKFDLHAMSRQYKVLNSPVAYKKLDGVVYYADSYMRT